MTPARGPPVLCVLNLRGFILKNPKQKSQEANQDDQLNAMLISPSAHHALADVSPPVATTGGAAGSGRWRRRRTWVAAKDGDAATEPLPSSQPQVSARIRPLSTLTEAGVTGRAGAAAAHVGAVNTHLNN